MLTPTGSATVDHLLEVGAKDHPERPFVVFERESDAVETISWRDAYDQANRLAGELQRLGVRRRSRVNVHMGNRPGFLTAWFACARLGAIMVPTNTASSTDELAFQLDHSGAEVAITEEKFRDGVVAAGKAAASLRHIILDPGLGVENGGHALDPDFGPRSRPGDTLGILYTSGTTARPKGVMVTHAAYAYAGLVLRAAISLQADDRFITVLPLFHGNAQYYSVMSTLMAGSTLILTERFSASRYFQQAARHGATVGSLFAAPARMILAQPSQATDATHRLRAMVFAQNLSQQHQTEWNVRFGVPIIQLYGMTETVGPPTFNPLLASRPESIGKPSLGYCCRVVDARGRSVRVGEAGELLIWGIPGKTLMRGYYKDPAATASALHGNWLHTGDLVRSDAEGYLYFVDRAKDMLKIAGENVAASEVESVIKSHPLVFDAAVVGVPDAIRDERMVAFVVARDSSLAVHEIQSWCQSRLARFRRPSEVILCRELPRTPVGKIQKHILKANYLSSGANLKPSMASLGPGHKPGA
jgi:crotonobetaine/carnitine-CoA ligase